MNKSIAIVALISALTVTSCTSNNKQENNNNNTKKEIVMKTIELTKEQFLEKVVNFEVNATEWNYLGDKPAIVDFYASWCGPCKTIAPILEELAADYSGEIYIYKVNTENEQDLAAAFGIRSIPTLLFIPMGEKPQLMQGAMSKAQFKEAIDKVLLKK